MKKKQLKQQIAELKKEVNRLEGCLLEVAALNNGYQALLKAHAQRGAERNVLLSENIRLSEENKTLLAQSRERS